MIPLFSTHELTLFDVEVLPILVVLGLICAIRGQVPESWLRFGIFQGRRSSNRGFQLIRLYVPTSKW